MKGALMGWVAIIAVVSIGVFAAYWASKVTGTDRAIVDRTSDVVAVVNAAESVRTLLNPAVEQIAQKAAYDVGMNGARISEWDSAKPDLATITETLTKEIRQRLSTGEDGFGGKVLSWGGHDISLTQGDDSFTVAGNIEYAVEDSNIKSMISIKHNFNLPVQSGFFGLIKTGRNLLESESWSVAKSVIESTKGNECKQKVSALSGDPYVLTTSNFLRFAFQCGYENNLGLASLEKYDVTQSNSLANNIALALQKTLAGKYGFEFEIKPTISQRENDADVNLQIKITDKKTVSPTDPQEFLTLKFTNKFEVSYGIESAVKSVSDGYG